MGTRMWRSLVLPVGILVLVVAVAACGDDEPSTNTTVSSASTSTSSSTPTLAADTIAEASETSTTTAVPAVDLAALDQRLQFPKVGDPTTYLRGAFDVREGAPIHTGLRPDGPVNENTGYLESPEHVVIGGVAYVAATESSDDPASTARQVRLVRVSDLVPIDGSRLDEIITSTISFVDEFGGAYTNEAPVPLRESAHGASIRVFVNESNDIIVGSP